MPQAAPLPPPPPDHNVDDFAVSFSAFSAGDEDEWQNNDQWRPADVGAKGVQSVTSTSEEGPMWHSFDTADGWSGDGFDDANWVDADLPTGGFPDGGEDPSIAEALQWAKAELEEVRAELDQARRRMKTMEDTARSWEQKAVDLEAQRDRYRHIARELKRQRDQQPVLDSSQAPPGDAAGTSDRQRVEELSQLLDTARKEAQRFRMIARECKRQRDEARSALAKVVPRAGMVDLSASATSGGNGKAPDIEGSFMEEHLDLNSPVIGAQASRWPGSHQNESEPAMLALDGGAEVTSDWHTTGANDATHANRRSDVQGESTPPFASSSATTEPAVEGAALLGETSDALCNVLGDDSTDVLHTPASGNGLSSVFDAHSIPSMEVSGEAMETERNAINKFEEIAAAVHDAQISASNRGDGVSEDNRDFVALDERASVLQTHQPGASQGVAEGVTTERRSAVIYEDVGIEGTIISTLESGDVEFPHNADVVATCCKCASIEAGPLPSATMSHSPHVVMEGSFGEDSQRPRLASEGGDWSGGFTDSPPLPSVGDENGNTNTDRDTPTQPLFEGGAGYNLTAVPRMSGAGVSEHGAVSAGQDSSVRPALEREAVGDSAAMPSTGNGSIRDGNGIVGDLDGSTKPSFECGEGDDRAPMSSASDADFSHVDAAAGILVQSYSTESPGSGAEDLDVAQWMSRNEMLLDSGVDVRASGAPCTWGGRDGLETKPSVDAENAGVSPYVASGSSDHRAEPARTVVGSAAQDAESVSSIGEDAFA